MEYKKHGKKVKLAYENKEKDERDLQNVLIANDDPPPPDPTPDPPPNDSTC